jgi:hypothetical protein
MRRACTHCNWTGEEGEDIQLASGARGCPRCHSATQGESLTNPVMRPVEVPLPPGPDARVAEARRQNERRSDAVNHPAHYGGADNPYEAIKVIEAWKLDFHLGNAAKYIARAGKKEGEDKAKDLAKAEWYIHRALELALKEKP